MQLNQALYSSMNALFKDLTDVSDAFERFKIIYEGKKLEGYSYFTLVGLTVLLNSPQIQPDSPALQLFFRVSRFVLETLEALRQYLYAINYILSAYPTPGVAAQRILDLMRIDTQVPNIGVITEYVLMNISLSDFRIHSLSEQAHDAVSTLRSQPEILAYLLYVMYHHSETYYSQCNELLKRHTSRGIQPSQYLISVLSQPTNYYTGNGYQLSHGMMVSSAYSQANMVGLQQRQLQYTPQFGAAIYNKDLATIIVNIGPAFVNDQRFLLYLLSMCQPITTTKLAHLILALSSVTDNPHKYFNQSNMAYFVQVYLTTTQLDQTHKELLFRQHQVQYNINVIFALLKTAKIEVHWKDILGILEQQVSSIDKHFAQTIIAAYSGYYIDSNQNICLCENCANRFISSPSKPNIYTPTRARQQNQVVDKLLQTPPFALFDHIFRDDSRCTINAPYYYDASLLIGIVLYFNRLVKMFNEVFFANVIPYLKEGKEVPAQFEQQYVFYCKTFFVISQIWSIRVVVEKGAVQTIKGFPLMKAMDILYYAFKPQTNLFHACLSQQSNVAFRVDLLDYIYDVFNPVFSVNTGNSPNITPVSPSMGYNTRVSRPDAWLWSSPGLVKSIFRVYSLVDIQLRSIFNDILGISGNKDHYNSDSDPISKCPEQFLATLVFVDLDLPPILQDTQHQKQQQQQQSVKKNTNFLQLLTKPHELITKAMLRVCTTFLLQRYLFKTTKQQTNQSYLDAIVATNPDIVLFASEVLWRRAPNNMGKIIDVIQELRLIEPIVRTCRSFEFVCDAAAFASGREFLNPALFIINAMQTHGRTFAEEFLIFVLKKTFRTLRNIDGKTMRELCMILTEDEIKLCSMIFLPYAGDQSRCIQGVKNASSTKNANDIALTEILDILAQNQYGNQTTKLHLMNLLTESLVITNQGNGLQVYQNINFLDTVLNAILPASYNQYKFRGEQCTLSSSPITESMQLVFFKFIHAYKTYFKSAFPSDSYLESLFILAEKVIKHCLPKAEIIEKSPMGVFFDASVTADQSIWDEAKSTVQKYLQGRLTSDEIVAVAATKQKNSCSTLAYQLSYCTFMHTIIELLDSPIRCAELLAINEHDVTTSMEATWDSGTIPETPLLHAELSLASISGLLMGSGILSDVFIPQLCTVLLNHLNSTVPLLNLVGFELLYCFCNEIDATDKEAVRLSKRWTATFSHIYCTKYFTRLSEMKYKSLSADRQKCCEKIETERFGITDETPIETTIDNVLGDKKGLNYDLSKVYQAFMSGTPLHMTSTTPTNIPQIVYSPATQANPAYRDQDRHISYLPPHNYFKGLLSRHRQSISPTLVKVIEDITTLTTTIKKPVYDKFANTLSEIMSNYQRVSLLEEIISRNFKDTVYQNILSCYLVSASLSSNDGRIAGPTYRSGSLAVHAALPNASLLADINFYLKNNTLIGNLANVALLSGVIVEIYDKCSTEQGAKFRMIVFHYSLIMLWDLVDSASNLEEQYINTEGVGTSISALSPSETSSFHVKLLTTRYKRAIILGHWLGFLVFGARYIPLKRDIDFLKLIDISAQAGTFILLVIFLRSFLRHSLDSPGLPATSGLVIVIVSKLYDVACNLDHLDIHYPKYQIDMALALIGDFQSEAYTWLERAKLYQHSILYNSSLQSLFSSSELIGTSITDGNQLELALKPPPFKYIDPEAKIRQSVPLSNLNMLRLKTSFNPLFDTSRQEYCIPSHIFRSEMHLGILYEIQRSEDPQKTPFPLILSFLAANPSLYAFLERTAQTICIMPEISEGKRRACYHSRNLVHELLHESTLSVPSRGPSTPSMTSIRPMAGSQPSSIKLNSTNLSTMTSNISLKNIGSDDNNPGFTYIASFYIATSLFRASTYTVICSNIRLFLHKAFSWAPTTNKQDAKLQKLLEDTVIEALVRLTAEYILSLLHRQIRDFGETILTSKKDPQIKFTNDCNMSAQTQDDSEFSELSYQQGDSFSLQFLDSRVDTTFTTNSTSLCTESLQKFSATSVTNTTNKQALPQALLKNLCRLYEQLDSHHRLKGDTMILNDLASTAGHKLTCVYPYIIKNDSVMFSVPYLYVQLDEAGNSSSVSGMFSQTEVTLILSTVFGYKASVLPGKPISLLSPDSAKVDQQQKLDLQIVAQVLAEKMAARFSTLKSADSRLINDILLSTYSQAASMFTAINATLPLLPYLELESSRPSTGFSRVEFHNSLYISLCTLERSIEQSTEDNLTDYMPDIYCVQLNHPILVPLHSIRAAISLYSRSITTQTRGAFVSLILSLGEWAISHVSLDTSIGIADKSADWKPAFDVANAFQMNATALSKSDLHTLAFKDISYSEILEPLLSSFAKLATPSLECITGKGYRPYFSLRTYHNKAQFIELISANMKESASRLKKTLSIPERPCPEDFLSSNFFKHVCTYSSNEDTSSYYLNNSIPVALFKNLLTTALDLDIPELYLKLLTLVKLRLVATIAHTMLWEIYLNGLNTEERSKTIINSNQFWFADVLINFGLNLVKCKVITGKILDTTISGALKYICNYLNRHYEKKISSSNRPHLATISAKLASESGIYFATCCHDLVSAVSKIALGLCFTNSITYLPSCCNISNLSMISHFLVEAYINTLETISLLQAQDDRPLGILTCSRLSLTLERLMRLLDMIGDYSSDIDDYLDVYRLFVSTGYNPFSAHGFSSDHSDFLRIFIKNSSTNNTTKFTIESQVLNQLAHLEHLHTAVLEDINPTTLSASASQYTPLPISILAYKMLTHLITVIIPQLSDMLCKEDEYNIMNHYIARFNALGYFMGDRISSILIDAVLYKLLKRNKEDKLYAMANGLGVFICYLIYACPEQNLQCSYKKSAVLAHFLERLLRFVSYLTSFKYKASHKLQGLMTFRSLDLMPNLTLRTDNGRAESDDVVIDSACIILYRVLFVLLSNLLSKSSLVFAYRNDFIYVLTHYLLYISPKQSIIFSHIFIAIISESSFIDASLSTSDLDSYPYCSFSLEYALYYAQSNMPLILRDITNQAAAASAPMKLTKELRKVCADIGIECLPGSSTSSGHTELMVSSSAQWHILQLKPELSVMSLNAVPLSLNPVYNQFFTSQAGNPSWKHYLRLLYEVIDYIQLTPQIMRQFNTPDVYNTNSCFVKSTIRLLELLKHDFPSFISFYKMHLAAIIPYSQKALRSSILTVSVTPLTHCQIANSMDLDVVRDVKEICLAPPLAGFHTGLTTVRSPNQAITEFSSNVTLEKPITHRNFHAAATIHDSFAIRLRDTGALAQINELRELAAKSQFLRTSSMSDLQASKTKINKEKAASLIEKLCKTFVSNAADQSGTKDNMFVYAFVFYACTELLSFDIANQRVVTSPGELIACQLFERLFQYQSTQEYHLKYILHTFLIHLGEPNRISYMFTLLLKHLAMTDSQLRKTLKECVEEMRPADPPWALQILRQLINEDGLYSGRKNE